MYTISFYPPTQLTALAAALAVSTVFAAQGLSGLPGLVQFDTGLSKLTDDRGSGRIGSLQSLSGLLAPNYLLGFRGSGRIDGDPQETPPSLRQDCRSTSAGNASTSLAYRGSGRIKPTPHVAV